MTPKAFASNMEMSNFLQSLHILGWIIFLVILDLAQGRDSCAPEMTPEQSDDHLRSAEGIIDTILQNSTTYYRPNVTSGTPTLVICDLYINSFDSISVDTMVSDSNLKYRTIMSDFSVNIYLRQSWKDKRLEYSSIFPNITKVSLDNKLFDKVWVPDLFFSNEKESHTHGVTVPNKLIRIYPDGTVLYSARYTLRLACHMKLYDFPFDKQVCWMKLESYAYTTDEIEFIWRDIDPVQINEDLELPQFDMTSMKTESECTQSYVTGNFTCLKVEFSLVRHYGYFMIQTYVPSILIVVLSWVSFWINIDAVPARISLGVLTVLTLTTQCVGVWMNLPQVSYIKAIDVWMSMCVLFVFAAMLEFAVVNTLARKEIRRMSIKCRENNEDGAATDMIKKLRDEYTYGSTKRYDPNSRMIARKVDKAARILFPGAFTLFNIAYWIVYKFT